VNLVIVPGANHSFGVVPEHTDNETRLREHISRGAYSYPMSEFFLQTLTDWLLTRLSPNNAPARCF
jgi:hypothetical protein